MIRMALTTHGFLAVTLAVGSVVFQAAPGSAEVVTELVGSDESTCDFDRDGFDDLAVGNPGYGGDVNPGPLQSGAVQVLVGSGVGLTAEGNQSWDQDTPGILGVSEGGDAFGSPLVCGDFDGDGFDDLAIGVRYEDVDLKSDAGAVQVLFGSGAGLSVEGNQIWDQDSPGILGVSEAGDHFGWSMASGDFDGDGFDDLAIGVPHENKGGEQDSGAVQVLFGSGAGLAVEANQFWDQGTPGILGGRAYEDYFGRSLASGDFDGDGFDDLAIGVSGEDPYLDDGVKQDAGKVQVLFGSGVGLTAAGNQSWHQGKPGILEAGSSSTGSVRRWRRVILMATVSMISLSVSHTRKSAERFLQGQYRCCSDLPSD